MRSKTLIPLRRGGVPVAELITEGLGYCCPHLFFTLFPSTRAAAVRLGVTKRAINKQKARSECTGCAGCQWGKLKALERAVQQRPCPSNDPLPTSTSPPPEQPIRVVRRAATSDPEADD